MTMTRPSERELATDIEDISARTSQSRFVQQVAAVIEGDLDSVDATPPRDVDHLELVLRVTDATDISLTDAWLAVDAAGADPEPLADFTTAPA